MRRRIDLWLVFAVLLGIALRVLPVVRWGFGALVRDEAQYANLGRNIVAGNGLISPQDWLWAPAYPYLIALFQTLLQGTAVTRTLPYFQCLIGGLTCIVAYAIAFRVFENRRAAVLAALMYAVHPTLIYFSGRLWCEAIYGPVLLTMVLATLWARDGRAARGVIPGVLLGLCVLLRGVATYIPPLVLIALLWPEPGMGYRDAIRRRYRHGLTMGLALLVAVAPYSIHASAKHGGVIVSDATVGNLMYLGNNDFTPITFDYGNGIFKQIARSASTRQGRKHCKAPTPAEWNQCEVDKGVEWILDNPGTFLSRMPMRTAQLVNPHSFLTRALRWGKYDGVPWWLKELLILGIAGTTFVILLGGTVGACARGRGPYAWLAVGVVAYTVAASAALYGLTRFRIPIEPLWMIYLAGLLAEPRLAWETLRAERVRLVLAVFWTPLLLLHMLWFLPTAWPGLTW